MVKKIGIVAIVFLLYSIIFAGEAYGATTVSSYSELQTALNNKETTIYTSTSIDCTGSLYINYAVKICAASDNNAIRYNGSGTGSFFIIQSGGTLTLQSIVIDCRTYANSNGLTAMTIQNGGKLIFSGSIIDGGTNNKGLYVASEGTVEFVRGDFAYCKYGLYLNGNAKVSFTGSGNFNIWNSTYGIYFNNYTGTCDLTSYAKMYNNTYGIYYSSGSTGTLNIKGASIYSNSEAGIVGVTGNLNMSSGSIYSNKKQGIILRGMKVTMTGGSIYSNSTIGVDIQSGYTGSFKMSGGTIKTNTTYAISHGQTADGSCTITGGTVSGNIYLADTDNYVNTNSSYPTLSIKPSKYALGRKLVKTASNTAANTEIANVTMAASGSYYKYVQDEYIVVWSGGNVIVKHVDQDGNVLDSELLNGSIGTAYTTSSKTFDGYALVTTPSNATGTFTSADITATYVYAFIKGSITIINVDNLDETKLLSGGTFKLEMLDDDGNVDSTFTALELTAGDDGTVIFEEIVPGKYMITQILAPSGYNLNQNVINVETTIDSIDAEITAKNMAKVVLPETGGINYSVFISGIGVAIITLALIISQRKKKIIIYKN